MEFLKSELPPIIGSYGLGTLVENSGKHLCPRAGPQTDSRDRSGTGPVLERSPLHRQIPAYSLAAVLLTERSHLAATEEEHLKSHSIRVFSLVIEGESGNGTFSCPQSVHNDGLSAKPPSVLPEDVGKCPERGSVGIAEKDINLISCINLRISCGNNLCNRGIDHLVPRAHKQQGNLPGIRICLAGGRSHRGLSNDSVKSGRQGREIQTYRLPGGRTAAADRLSCLIFNAICNIHRSLHLITRPDGEEHFGHFPIKHTELRETLRANNLTLGQEAVLQADLQVEVTCNLQCPGPFAGLPCIVIDNQIQCV